MPITFQDYEALCKEIWEHNRRYYAAEPIISDIEFDRLLKKLEDIEKQHPEWISPFSPTQRVGESLSEGFQRVVHRVPMLSLANTYSLDEIADFIKRTQKAVDKKGLAFSCELKMDGIAISATYENGIFIRGTTRGDGYEGDDITTNMRTIKMLPLRIYGENIPKLLELRGEVFMPHAVFHKLNETKAQTSEALWANPRNAAAGSLKLLDPNEVMRRELSVVFYGIAENSELGIKTQHQVHEYLKSLNLPTLHSLALCHSIDEIWDFANQVRLMRPKLEFDIDGIVIKLNDLHDQKRLGSTSKHPRWAVAYKFAAEQALTRIRDITVQVGRTGILTPVAELDPVPLAGSVIARATLHNEDEIQRKDIRIGDIATIEKGGDVIPKIVCVETSQRTSESVPWKMPEHCPSCHSKVFRQAGEVAVRCLNSGGCPEQQLRRLIYFAGKDSMDIENMGEKVVEQLVLKGFIKRPSDIYRLTEEQLYQLEGFKAKSVKNLLESIDKSRNVTLYRFIMALGIKHIGTTTAELLASKSGNIEALMKMSAEELLRIDGVGEKVAQAIIEYFSDETNKKEIEDLISLGIKPEQRVALTYLDHLFQGKNIVLTGSLQQFTRQGASSLIKERGGKVSDSVSKKTDFVIYGESAGSKLDKARELGIPTYSEAEFIQML